VTTAVPRLADAADTFVAVRLVTVPVVINATALLIDETDAPEAVSAVNAPVLGVDAPMVVPLILPPVIATLLAFCVDIVPRPEMSVFGIDATAVKADVPEALT
jgi:hypothetical protein